MQHSLTNATCGQEEWISGWKVPKNAAALAQKNKKNTPEFPCKKSIPWFGAFPAIDISSRCCGRRRRRCQACTRNVTNDSTAQWPMMCQAHYLWTKKQWNFVCSMGFYLNCSQLEFCLKKSPRKQTSRMQNAGLIKSALFGGVTKKRSLHLPAVLRQSVVVVRPNIHG